jgi:hypothetical protein
VTIDGFIVKWPQFEIKNVTFESKKGNEIDLSRIASYSLSFVRSSILDHEHMQHGRRLVYAILFVSNGRQYQ